MEKDDVDRAFEMAGEKRSRRDDSENFKGGDGQLWRCNNNAKRQWHSFKQDYMCNCPFSPTPATVYCAFTRFAVYC